MSSQSASFQIFLLPNNREDLRDWLEAEFPLTQVLVLESAEAALAHAHLQADLFIVVLEEGLHLPQEFIQQYLELSPITKFIFIGADLPLRRVIKIMKSGAWDYLDSSENYKDDLKELIRSLLETAHFSSKDKNNLVEQFRQLGIIGQSKLSRRLYKKVLKAAAVDSTVLLLGEHGVGKELIAKTIHQLSKRRNGPVVLVDCLSWPAELLEEELFGREKNVFEGVLKRKIGKIEAASGGSIILDNAQALPLNVQEKLLRALQEQKFIRPGGSNIVFFNARLMVVSSENLERAMQHQKIRKDLYYQLMGYPISIPPLRKRPSDILVLSNFFLRQFLRRNKLKSLIFTQEAKEKLTQYPFPGNIRELKTVVETAATLADSTEIGEADLSLEEIHLFPLENWLEKGLTLEEITYEAIQFYLKKNNGNALDAAKELGIGKSTIYRILKTSRLNKYKK